MTSTPQNQIARLKDELRAVRDNALKASQRGDFRTVAKLTSTAAELNRRIEELKLSLP
jgi:hypothetical protein